MKNESSPEKKGLNVPQSIEQCKKYNIRLGSTSASKIEALKEACGIMGIEADIQTLPASSEINDQPYGFDETYRGALNRALNTKKDNPNAMSIGIENGIIPVGDKFIDMAVIVVLTPDGKNFMSTSAGIEFPKEAVETARTRGFESNTAGSVIAEMVGGSTTDPHSTLTGGKISRKKILTDAIVVALSNAISK